MRRFRIEFSFEKATALPACTTATVFLSRGTTTYTTTPVNVGAGVAGVALGRQSIVGGQPGIVSTVFPVRLKETRIAINCRLSKDPKGEYGPKVSLDRLLCKPTLMKRSRERKNSIPRFGGSA
jgi:hypothetical protein